MKKKIIAMLAAMMCLASSSLSYSSVAIAANSLNSNDIAEVKITSSDLKECNLVTESKNDGCWINLNLKSGVFAMSGNARQSFSIIGSFERKDNDLYLYPENASAEFYVLHREKDHFVSQSDEIGVQLKAGLVFYADNDAFWEILLDWTLSGNEPSNTGETAEQNTSFIMGDVNDDGVFSVSDVVLLQKWLLAVPDTHLENWRAANFCDDDRLDVFDLTLMKRAMIYGETGQPISPTTQPIGLNHTEEVIELLKNYDLNDYNEAYRKSLQKMFDRFNEDGYFYHFAYSENEENKITLNEDQTNAAIWLMPYANLEDSGILYHVAYQGKYYQVYYYFTDPAYTVSDLWEYMAQRLRIKNINIVDEKFGIVDNSNDEQTDMSAYFAVDDTHYCKIRTFEPEDALMDFLQVLSYEKFDIADNTSTDPITPVNVQPISYKDMDAAIDAINNNDVSSYPDAEREDYRKMFECFSEDGYIYHFTDAENAITLRDDHPNAAIWLMPYANYEDTGILYHVAYQGKYYQVCYYFTDSAYAASDLWEYLEQRLDIKNINVVDEKYGIVDNSNNEQTDVSAYFAIDDTHYCKVKTFEPEDALMDFLQVLNYEKLDIAGNTSTDPITSVNEKQSITFVTYDAYREFLEQSNLPEGFVEYEEVEAIGSFNSLVFLSDARNSDYSEYMYGFSESPKNTVFLTIVPSSKENTSVIFTPLSIDDIDQSDMRFTKNKEVSGIFKIDNLSYKYIKGTLLSIMWEKNDLRYTLSCASTFSDYQLDVNTFVSKMLVYELVNSDVLF